MVGRMIKKLFCRIIISQKRSLNLSLKMLKMQMLFDCGKMIIGNMI